MRENKMAKDLVSPEVVKNLRILNKWSQSELAALSGTTTRTISGIENETKQTRQVQRKVFDGLCEAFDEREEVLRGNEPLSETDQKIKASFEITSQQNLALDLICHTYNVRKADLISSIPALFALFAEKALFKMSQEYNEDKSLIEFGHSDDVMGKYFLEDFEQLSELMERREHDIETKNLGSKSAAVDLLMRLHSDDDVFTHYLWPAWNNFLAHEMDAAGSIQYDNNGGRISRISVCIDTLEKITCGSRKASKALEKGYANISEIPKALWEPRNSGERVEWLEEAWDRGKKKAREEFTQKLITKPQEG
jgi:transcriptional regulator with XRE-family HTH domain